MFDASFGFMLPGLDAAERDRVRVALRADHQAGPLAHVLDVLGALIILAGIPAMVTLVLL